MSNVFFISDLHLGHKRILDFSPDRAGDDILEHDHALVVKWNQRVGKRDTTYVLGDVCFDIRQMPLLEEMNGGKVLIIGNHDKFDLGVYRKYFYKIHGFQTYKGYWLSHAPMHPAELRGRKNIHGHVHSNIIRNHYGDPDPRYIPVCVEQCDGYPISFDEIHAIASPAADEDSGATEDANLPKHVLGTQGTISGTIAENGRPHGGQLDWVGD